MILTRKWANVAACTIYSGYIVREYARKSKQSVSLHVKQKLKGVLKQIYLFARLGSIKASSASFAADMAFLVSAAEASSDPETSISGLMFVKPSMDWLC